jgi:hypothetical protein
VRYDLTFGGGHSYTGLDRFARVVDLLWQKYSVAPATLEWLTYSYDRASNRTFRQNHLAFDRDEAYTYDGLHRLKDFARGHLQGPVIISPTFQQDWQLDSTGNWGTFHQSDPTALPQILVQSRTHNKFNEITAISNLTGPSWIVPSYDRNGNTPGTACSPFSTAPLPSASTPTTA